VLLDVVALFGAGVASFLAPCVVPLVPAYLGIIMGDVPSHDNRAATVWSTVSFVGGFTSVFTSLGVLAGLIGRSTDRVEEGIRIVGGSLVAVLGVVMLTGQAATLTWRPLDRLANRRGRFRAAAVGVAFGAAWTPCVGPLLGAALVAATRAGDPIRGGVLLAAYASGIGTPFVIASLGLASSETLTRRARRLSGRLHRVAAVALIVLGTLLLTGWYEEMTSCLSRFTPALGGL
jgi:cytochrome c-type biogenesis protein